MHKGRHPQGANNIEYNEGIRKLYAERENFEEQGEGN